MTWHALSFDVEHWYDATLVDRGSGAKRASGDAEREVDAVLSLLAERGVRATFFVLGALAAELPQVVRRVAGAGHEVACHGWSHALLGDLGPDAFERAAKDARSLLQDLSGQEVRGYRAATWSIDRTTAWASERLCAVGFGYDSSVFPMRTPLYGVSAAPRSPYRIATAAGEILELPPAVGRLGPLSVPLAGGVYWRILPVGAVLLGLGRMGGPAVLYAHPWEIAPAGWRLPPTTPPIVRLAMRFGVGHLRRVLDALVRGIEVRPLADLETRARAGDLARYRWRRGVLVADPAPARRPSPDLS